jgi:hypothetical protein
MHVSILWKSEKTATVQLVNGDYTVLKPHGKLTEQ